MTDALKGALIALANAAMAMLQEFGVPLTDGQQAAIIGLVNAVLLVYMLAQHKKSTTVSKP